MFNSTRDNFEIETLLHHNHRHEGDEVYSVINPSVESDYPTPELFKSRSRNPSSKQLQQQQVGECSGYDSSGYDSPASSSTEEEQYVTLRVNGADIGDLPTEYTVEGIRPDEFPVIGTYVDKRILPGFRYRVRRLGGLNRQRYLFSGQALRLQSIGMGYGKRITFQGERLNQNSNYFYSDTHPAGFALSLVAVEARDQFTVTELDADHPVAEARVVDVLEQEEIDSEVDEKKNVRKQVRVSMRLEVNYLSDNHGLVSLYSQQHLHVSGVAVVERQKGARQAFTTFIQGIELPPHYGEVTFRA